MGYEKHKLCVHSDAQSGQDGFYAIEKRVFVKNQPKKFLVSFVIPQGSIVGGGVGDILPWGDDSLP